jgi:dihydroorotate dehydrogenase (fumarate)
LPPLSQLEGFTHDDTVHQHCFFTPGSAARGRGDTSAWNGRSSLNTLGYSPVTLSEYLGIINEIVGQRHLGTE